MRSIRESINGGMVCSGVMYLEKIIDVSVVICAYNEEDVIVESVESVDKVMKNTGWSYEIIVVDDGSADKTAQRIFTYRQLNGQDHIRIVCHKKNMGKGNAIKTGFNHSRGNYIVFIDGDLDVDPTLIPAYVEALKDNDIAVASKWHNNSYTVTSLRRKFLSIGFNSLSRLFLGIRLRDTQTGLKAFRRKVLEKMMPKLLTERFAFDLELISTCNHCGFKIVALPVKVCIKKIISVREIFRMALDLLRIAYRLRISREYQRS